MANSIDREAFFAALREFFPTENAFEARIYPNRIEVHRFTREEHGQLIVGVNSDLDYKVEKYLLVGPDPVDNSPS